MVRDSYKAIFMRMVDRPLIETYAHMLNLMIESVKNGPLAAGLLAAYAPWPLHLPYLLYLPALLASGIAVVLTPETVERPIGHIHDLSLTNISIDSWGR
jgi:hypothetical protein